MSKKPKSIGPNSKREVLIGEFIHTTDRDAGFLLHLRQLGLCADLAYLGI